jgi:hypothetical protein
MTYRLMKAYNWFGVNDVNCDPLLELQNASDPNEKTGLLSNKDVEHGHSHSHGHHH